MFVSLVLEVQSGQELARGGELDQQAGERKKRLVERVNEIGTASLDQEYGKEASNNKRLGKPALETLVPNLPRELDCLFRCMEKDERRIRRGEKKGCRRHGTG